MPATGIWNGKFIFQGGGGVDVISGEGLAWRSAWEVSEEVKRGRLVTVLDEFAFPGNNIYAVYPERRLLPAKVKFFIEFLRKTFGDPPYWE